MDKILKIALIIGAMTFILLMDFMGVLGGAEQNCQRYEEICYRIEVGFLGHYHIETRCSGNNWDTQELECVDKGYFWEDLNNG